MADNTTETIKKLKAREIPKLGGSAAGELRLLFDEMTLKPVDQAS
jgi:hypothetical protein